MEVARRAEQHPSRKAVRAGATGNGGLASKCGLDVGLTGRAGRRLQSSVTTATTIAKPAAVTHQHDTSRTSHNAPHSNRPARRGASFVCRSSPARGAVPATSESEKISFNHLNRATGHRIKYLKVDAVAGRSPSWMRSRSSLLEEVPNEDIVKGYKVDTNTFIEVTKEELENVALESTVGDEEANDLRQSVDELAERLRKATLEAPLRSLLAAFVWESGSLGGVKINVVAAGSLHATKAEDLLDIAWHPTTSPSRPLRSRRRWRRGAPARSPPGPE